MSDDNQAEKHPNANQIKQLFNADLVATRAAAEERGAIAAKIKGMKESHGLNTDAYRIAKTIAKRPAGDREQLKRAVDLYCDYLGVGEQLDLEDRINANVNSASKNRTETEKVMDGQPGGASQGGGDSDRQDAGHVGSIIRPNTPAGDAAIGKFREAIEEATTTDAVNDGLDRFTKDHPKMAEMAGKLAIDRINKIEAEAGGGEDIRSEVQRKAGTDKAEQIVSDAKKGRKPRAAPKAKAAAGDEKTVH